MWKWSWLQPVVLAYKVVTSMLWKLTLATASLPTKRLNHTLGKEPLDFLISLVNSKNTISNFPFVGQLFSGVPSDWNQKMKLTAVMVQLKFHLFFDQTPLIILLFYWIEIVPKLSWWVVVPYLFFSPSVVPRSTMPQSGFRKHGWIKFLYSIKDPIRVACWLGTRFELLQSELCEPRPLAFK